MPNKVKQIQQQELELLKIFDKICRDNSLTYYALGGTLLGAMRHQGFIPWDDDMDLGMPRKDYEQFIEQVQKQLPSQYVVQIHDDNLGNTSIRDLSTAITFGDTVCYPFIDIFPLDGFPNKQPQRQLHKNLITLLRMLSKLSVVDRLLERDRGTFENLLVVIAKAIKLNKLLDTKRLNHRLHQRIKRYDFEDSMIVGNVLGTYREKEMVAREIFGVPQYLPFESIVISCPENPHTYLTNIYGDYMTLPPEASRKGHFESTWGD